MTPLRSHHLRNHTSHQGPDYSTEKCVLFRGYWWKNQKCKMGEWDQAKHTRRKVLVSTLQKTKNFLDHVIINLHPSSIHDRDYRYFPSIPSNEIGFSNIMHMRCSVDMQHKWTLYIMQSSLIHIWLLKSVIDNIKYNINIIFYYNVLILYSASMILPLWRTRCSH